MLVVEFYSKFVNGGTPSVRFIRPIKIHNLYATMIVLFSFNDKLMAEWNFIEKANERNEVAHMPKNLLILIDFSANKKPTAHIEVNYAIECEK